MKTIRFCMCVNYIANSNHQTEIEVEDSDIEGLSIEQIREKYHDALVESVWEEVDCWIEVGDEE